MSNVNYNLNNKGVRLIEARDAWVVGKNGKPRLNSDYQFVGKIEISMPNMIVTATDKAKPKYKGNTNDLNTVAKNQVVDYFYDEKGKRNKKSVAYLGIKKSK